MIIGVDHTQITVPPGAEREARNFYCRLLELREIEKPANRKKNGGFWLEVGDTQLHVGLEEGVDRSKTKAHVAFRVNNLNAWRDKLQTEGICIFESSPFPDAQAIEFRDPFGNRLELIQRYKQDTKA